MPTLLAVDEGKVGVDRVVRLIKADRKRHVHLVKEERVVPVESSSTDNLGPGFRRQPELRNRAKDLDLYAPGGNPGHGVICRYPLRIRWVLRGLYLPCAFDDDTFMCE